MNDITNVVETLDPAAFAAALANEHVADIVERLNAVPPETASAVLLAMPLERAVEVLDEPGLEHAAELLVAQPVTRAIELLKANFRRSPSRSLPAPRSTGPRPASCRVGRRNEGIPQSAPRLS